MHDQNGADAAGTGALSFDLEAAAESETTNATTPATIRALSDESAGGRIVKPSKGEVIFDSDTPARNVYYIQRGQVRLYTPGPNGFSRLLDILGPGQWFGAAALARTPTYLNRAVAVCAGTVLTEIPADRLLLALADDPEQLVELNRQLAGKLLAAYEEAARLVFEDCNQRLIGTLVRFSRSAACTPREDGDVVLRITHDQLAQAVGVARETVSLALTQLRQQNLLRTGRNELVFDPDALARFSATARRREPKSSDSSISAARMQLPRPDAVGELV
jgi:CRP/FNR family transcriptional regulator